MIKASIVVDKPYLNDRLFNPELNDKLFDGRGYKYIILKNELKKYNIDLSTHDINSPEISDIVIYIDTNKLPINYSKKNYLLLIEPPSVLPNNFLKKNHIYFNKIFTWKDDLVDNKKYFKMYFSFDLKRKYDPKKIKDKFCVMITRKKFSSYHNEAYSIRYKIIQWFNLNKRNKLDLYGYDWDSFLFKKFPFTFFNRFKIIKKILHNFFEAKLEVYKGELLSKFDVLPSYKFCICYENIYDIEGYITEKLFDCFFSRTVPVYLGANNVEKFIPENCFIDGRKFKTPKELYSQIRSIGIKEYNQYIESIENFLVSDKSKVFDSRYNSKLIVNEILKD